MSRILKTILISVLVALMACAFLACGGGNVDNVEKGIIYKKSDDVYIVTGYNDDGKTTELNIGEALKTKVGKAVDKVRIKAEAFKGNKSLTSIIVPDSTVEIDAGAFAGMISLRSLTVPFIGKTDHADAYFGQTATSADKSVDSERTIAHFFGTESYDAGYSATISFGSNSSNATTCFMPLTFREINVKAVKEDYVLPAYAFNGANILTKITLNEKVGEIGEYAFVGCANIEEIEIPASVKVIHTGAFKDCSRLNEVTFKENCKLENIGASAFEGVGVAQITLPASVKTIGESAFKSSELVTVDLPNYSELKIGNYAFYNCKELKNVFTDGITKGTIGVYAFYNCEELEPFDISGFTTIDPGNPFSEENN